NIECHRISLLLLFAKYINRWPINWRISAGISADLSLSDFYGTYAKNGRRGGNKVILKITVLTMINGKTF
ncbi:MAG: hypothetical protein MK172_10315, partial [Verrucomicrobiales bacterium]|nr:hypothetical protein [Verrucomicrobiales bacterium]